MSSPRHSAPAARTCCPPRSSNSDREQPLFLHRILKRGPARLRGPCSEVYSEALQRQRFGERCQHISKHPSPNVPRLSSLKLAEELFLGSVSGRDFSRAETAPAKN